MTNYNTQKNKGKNNAYNSKPFFNKNKKFNNYKRNYNNENLILASTLFISLLIISVFLTKNLITLVNIPISVGEITITILTPLILIIFELYGKKHSHRILKSSIYTMAIIIITLVGIQYIPNSGVEGTNNSIINPAFIPNLKDTFIFISLYFIPTVAALHLFVLLKEKKINKSLWVCSFLALLMAQILYMVIPAVMLEYPLNKNIIITEILLRLLLIVVYVIVVIGTIYIVKKRGKGSKKYEKPNGHYAESQRNSEENRNLKRGV